MRYEIRKLAFGETLDMSFRLVRDRFGLFTALAALAYVPLIFGQSTFQVSVAADGSIVTSSWLGIGLGYLIGFLVFPISQIAIYAAVTRTYLGEERSFSELVKTGGSLYLAYLGTLVLYNLGTLLLMLLFIIPGLIFGLRWILFGPICLVEGVFGGAALKRSSELVRGAWWRTAGLLFVSGVLVSIVIQAANLVVGWIPYVGWLLTAGIASVGVAFSSTVLCVLYFSLRCEKEDYDLQVLADQVSAAS